MTGPIDDGDLPGLRAEERTGLGRWLLVAIDSRCVPEWEFGSLVGCSSAEARAWVEAGLPGLQHEEARLDQVVTMLSLLAGSGHLAEPAQSAHVLELLERLFWSSDAERSARSCVQSSVGLRPGVVLPAVRPARKRRAAPR